MKTGLVLEGGGMRGLYTVGVLDAFSKAGALPGCVYGVSAGAANGASFVSNQPGRGKRVNLDYLGDKRYLSLRSFLKTRSLFGMDFIFGTIPNELDPFDYDAFLSSSTGFQAGVTDVLTGKAVYFDKQQMGRDLTVLKASSSLPVFSPMVEIDGKKYLDGGVSDPIPVKRAVQDGCERIVAVLTREHGYQKKKEPGRFYYRRKYKGYPNLVSALDQRHEVYAQSLRFLGDLQRSGKAIVIAPESPLQVGRFTKDKETLVNAYECGVRDGEAALESVRAFLGGK